MSDQKEKTLYKSEMKKQKLKNIPIAPKQTEAENQLKEITTIIAEQYSFEKIISIGSEINKIQKESCFANVNDTNVSSNLLNSYFLLLVPSHLERCNDVLIQQRLEEQLKPIASVTILIHRMDEFNTALQNGSTFFKSVYKKGIVLYDRNEEPFVPPGDGAPIRNRITKREQLWQKWHQLATDFLKGANFFIAEENNELAVFMLHQGLQHCYSAMIRVLTGYRTNSNNLRRLIKLIDLALPDSSFVVPNKSTPEDLRLMSIILKGYGDARYSDGFIVTKQDVSLIFGKVSVIIDNANKVCLQRINDLKDGKIKYSV